MKRSKTSHVASLIAMLCVTLGSNVLFAQVVVSEATHTIPTINADETINYTCQLTAKRYWNADQQGPYKAMLHIQGNGWLPVQPVAKEASLVEDFVAAGYMVFSPEIRGWNNPVQTGCDYADIDQQARDVESAFLLVLFNSWLFDMNNYGVLLSGGSAGGQRAMYFSRNTSASNKSLIRGVITIDSPLSFYHFWANNNDYYDPSYFEARTISLPNASGPDLEFNLINGGHPLNYLMQGYYREGVFTGLDCEPWSQVGSDCFSANSSEVWSFILGNSPLGDDPSYAPILMVAGAQDVVVAADSVLGACQSFGTLSYESDNATRYIADCGTGGEQFILRKSGGHGQASAVLPDILAWADAQTLQ